MRIAIVGATGFVGTTLCDMLTRRGDQVIALVRDADRARSLPAAGVRIVQCDPVHPQGPCGELAVADAVVNLAGAPLAGRRWSDAYRQQIRDSRILTTRAVVETMRGGTARVLVNASAVGFYGDRGEEPALEDDPPGAGFLADLCGDWEREARRAESFGVRVAIPRIGIVLGRGGALRAMLPPFRFGAGGALGSGRQWMPWIHIADMAAMIAWALECGDLAGSFNATAPNPVRNREFARTLGRVLHRPSIFRAPAFALRMALGGFAEAVLTSQRAEPRRAESLGFTWGQPMLEPALRSILKPQQ